MTKAQIFTSISHFRSRRRPLVSRIQSFLVGCLFGAIIVYAAVTGG